MSRRLAWVLALAAAAVLGAEWMRQPAATPAAAVVLAALVAAWVAWGWRGPGRGALAAGFVVTAMLGAHLLVSTWHLDRVRNAWPDVREGAVARASRRLGGDLDASAGLARSLASRAAPALSLPPAEAFSALEGLVSQRGPSHGVVLFDTHGHLRAWAGLQRVRLEAAGPELSAITTPFYLWLVARRQTSAGTAAAVVLLARSDDVPASGVALTDRFAKGTGVGLRFLPHRAAPPDSDVFDYVSSTSARDTLFAVQPVPPSAGDFYDRALGDARRRTAVLIVLVLIVAAAGAARIGGSLWLAPAAASLMTLARAPLRETYGPGSIFWPDTYFTDLLGPYSSSVGALLLLAVTVFTLSAALWRRGLRPTWPRAALAVALTLLAPYLLQRLARGITPPGGGVPVGLWLLWQSALALSASAIVLAAAALVRGAGAPRPAGLRLLAPAGIAVAAAATGLWLWQPEGAWPDWYPYLWAPALLLAIRPMRFRSALTTIALVAGSSAALLTWGATAEGRMVLAARDIEGLGDRTDPFALALLERMSQGMRPDRSPASAGELLLLWRRSTLGSQGYPVTLAVWERGGGRTLHLDLAELDLPPALVEGVAAEALAASRPVVRAVLRVPGSHAIAAIPFNDGRVLTIGVGPRSRLVAPTRLAQFLLGTSGDPEAPYDVVLAPPGRSLARPGVPVAWRREGWMLRGERVIALPGGSRHTHALVDLRGPTAVLQRGALVLVLDVAVLVLLWSLIELAAGRARPALAAWWARAHGSLRLRLSVSLALFFVTPTLVFALWSFGRLEDEFSGARALLLQRTLRDAAAALGQVEAPSAGAIDAASSQVGAELMLSRGGELRASSAPVLADLGLVDLLVPGPIYSRLAWRDEVEDAAPQQAAPAPTLVGYRLLSRADPAMPTIMASPEFLGDRSLRRREADLGTAVLVASVLGVLAALVLSAIAARTLARPIDRLRRAALGVGAGAAPGDLGSVPVELEPVRGALVQAARDVEAGQQAQRVLAWGEMARQVAHEIKNPLTPIRLGVQHLLRLGRERPAELGRQLPDTGDRILAEIDRLDAIARAFSRFAMPGGAPAAALETVDVATVVRDVVHLYRVGQGPTAWESEITGAPLARARRDELTEVLVNLCENARVAGARRVDIVVRAETGRVSLLVKDDGSGISADVLPRVFEPRFSTTTSGSGLGLAIARRLVESWGGDIGIASTDGAGTTVRVTLAAP